MERVNEPLESLQAEAANLILKSDDSHEEGRDRLRKALQKTYAILLEVKADAARAAELEQLFEAQGVAKARPYAHRNIRLCRLCLPGRSPHDYNRYARALAWAERQSWTARELPKRIATTKKGVHKLAALEKEATGEATEKKNADAARLDATTKRLAKAPTLGEVPGAETVGADTFVLVGVKDGDRIAVKSIVSSAKVLDHVIRHIENETELREEHTPDGDGQQSGDGDDGSERETA